MLVNSQPIGKESGKIQKNLDCPWQKRCANIKADTSSAMKG
jgi:hypothetical protein